MGGGGEGLCLGSAVAAAASGAIQRRRKKEILFHPPLLRTDEKITSYSDGAGAIPGRGAEPT
jgi:hypothetical protein